MSDVITITDQGIKKGPDILKLVPSDSPYLKISTSPYVYDFGNVNNSPIKLANDMIAALKHYGGLGLACPQVGLLQRMFVMGVDDEIVAFFNPKIIEASEETSMDKEGCLSFPNLYISIRRSTWIDVSYQDYNGEYRETHFSGLTARCFQHELDHLNGILITDIAGPLALKNALKAKSKREKKAKR